MIYGAGGQVSISAFIDYCLSVLFGIRMLLYTAISIYHQDRNIS